MVEARRGGSGGGTTLTGVAFLAGMTTVLIGALALTLTGFATGFVVELIRLVTFLDAAIFGAGFLAVGFETGLGVLATTFFSTTIFLSVFFAGLTGFGAAFAVVRCLAFVVERDFGLGAAFNLADLGFAAEVGFATFATFDFTPLPDNLAFAVIFAVVLDRLESDSLIRCPSLEIDFESCGHFAKHCAYVAK